MIIEHHMDRMIISFYISLKSICYLRPSPSWVRTGAINCPDPVCLAKACIEDEKQACIEYESELVLSMRSRDGYRMTSSEH